MRNTLLSPSHGAAAALPGAHRSARLLDAARRALRDAADRAHAGWQRYRSRRATDHALRRLDAHLLRDLGIDRSEIPSIAAAASGPGDPTRVRTTCGPRRLAASL